MQLRTNTDTATPSGTTQTLLRNGARRTLPRPISQFGTALVFGAATVGGPLETYGTVVDIPGYRFESRGMEHNLQCVGLVEPLGQLDTDDRVPPELEHFLHCRVQSESATSLASDADDIGSLRVIPPKALEYKVRVRFRKLGEEAPRVSIDPDLD